MCCKININLPKNEAIAQKTEYENYTNNTSQKKVKHWNAKEIKTSFGLTPNGSK